MKSGTAGEPDGRMCELVSGSDPRCCSGCAGQDGTDEDAMRSRGCDIARAPVCRVRELSESVRSGGERDVEIGMGAVLDGPAGCCGGVREGVVPTLDWPPGRGGVGVTVAAVDTEPGLEGCVLGAGVRGPTGGEVLPENGERKPPRTGAGPAGEGTRTATGLGCGGVHCGGDSERAGTVPAGGEPNAVGRNMGKGEAGPGSSESNMGT
jgi:hypothetical protein